MGGSYGCCRLYDILFEVIEGEQNNARSRSDCFEFTFAWSSSRNQGSDSKTYRNKTLDAKLRTERTKREARLLNKAKIAGVPCPIVLEVSEFGITMTKIRGKRADLIKNKNSAKTAGKYLAQLHASNLIHGDYTPANLIVSSGASQNLFVIDFGLGFFSEDVEDKAIDVLTMLKAIPESAQAQKAFLKGYSKYKNIPLS